MRVIHGATEKRAPAGFAPLAIGLTLTIIYLVSISVTNTSVHPAHSIEAAVFQGTWALDPLWMFCLIPSLGGLLAVCFILHCCRVRLKHKIESIILKGKVME